MDTLELHDLSTTWPLWIGIGALVGASSYNLATMKVPNSISVGTLLGALPVGLAASAGLSGFESLHGGVGSLLAATGLSLFLGVVLFSMRVASGGLVKMQAAFTAWVGCVLPTGPALIAAVTSLAGACIVSLAGYALWNVAVGPEESRPSLKAKGRGEVSQTSIPGQLLASVGALLGLVWIVRW